MKLKTEKFTVYPKQQVYSRKNDITMECTLYMDDKDGTFYYDLPQELHEIAQRLCKKGVFEKIVKSYVTTASSSKVGRSYINGLRGKGKEDLETIIKYCMQEMIAVETFEELLILYTVHERVKFVVDGEGNIYPSERLTDKPTAAFLIGNNNDIHASTMNPYSVGVGASIFLKTTVVSRSQLFSSDATKTTYRKLDNASCIKRFGEDSYERKLNAFEIVGDSWGCRAYDFDNISKDLERFGIKSIPYSPKAARFFYTYIYNLCLLAKTAQDFFFKSNELLLSKIEQDEIFLPMPEKIFAIHEGVEVDVSYNSSTKR